MNSEIRDVSWYKIRLRTDPKTSSVEVVRFFPSFYDDSEQKRDVLK